MQGVLTNAQQRRRPRDHGVDIRDHLFGCDSVFLVLLLVRDGLEVRPPHEHLEQLGAAQHLLVIELFVVVGEERDADAQAPVLRYFGQAVHPVDAADALLQARRVPRQVVVDDFRAFTVLNLEVRCADESAKWRLLDNPMSRQFRQVRLKSRQRRGRIPQVVFGIGPSLRIAG